MAAKRENISEGLSPLPKKGKGDIDDVDDEDEKMEPPPEKQPSWAASMKQDILAGVREVFQDELKPVKIEVAQLRTQVEEVDTTAKQALIVANEAKSMVGQLKAEQTAPNTEDMDKMFNQKIQEIQKQFELWRVADKTKVNITSVEGPKVVVIGGLKQVSFAAATQWTQNILAKAGVTALEIYKMGTPESEFTGMLFAKFTTPLDASLALKDLKTEAFKENNGKDFKNRVWCDFKAPIEHRICNSFLFSFRTQLIEWKFPKQCIDVDKDLGILKVEGKEVVKVEVVGDDFKITWIDPVWGTWEWLQSSKELAQITKVATDKLTTSRSQKKKGAGKGQ